MSHTVFRVAQKNLKLRHRQSSCHIDNCWHLPIQILQKTTRQCRPLEPVWIKHSISKWNLNPFTVTSQSVDWFSVRVCFASVIRTVIVQAHSRLLAYLPYDPVTGLETYWVTAVPVSCPLSGHVSASTVENNGHRNCLYDTCALSWKWAISYFSHDVHHLLSSCSAWLYPISNP